MVLQASGKRSRKGGAIGGRAEAHREHQSRKRRVKGKTGRLAGLLELPLDILLEIFGHLLPLDILHLARTSKQFRRVLMHKSSLSVWKSARANVVGLPNCPPSMAEPGFANLAFDSHCHVCLRSNTRYIDWQLRLRICSNCAATHLVPANSDYLHLVPSRTSKRTAEREVHYIKELQAVQAYVEALDPSDVHGLQKYCQERRALIEEHATYAVLCEDWADAQALSRSAELEEARQSRKQAIFEKLTELGWGDELSKITPKGYLKKHRLVNQTTRLTDRIWNNIKAPLVGYMEQMKTKRLERRKVAAINVLRAYKISCLPWTNIMPEPVDFCKFPEIKAILELSADADVDDSTFSNIVPNFSDIFDQWRVSIHYLLVDRFRQAQKDQLKLTVEFGFQHFTANPSIHATDEDILKKMRLATTVFKCRSCDESQYRLDVGPGYALPACYQIGVWADDNNPLFYPQVLGHRCLTVATEGQWDYVLPEGPEDPSIRLDISENEGKRHRIAWTCQSLVVDAHAGKMVEGIIATCDLDHTQTTAEEMDRLDARLACMNCADQTSDAIEVSVYAWRSALQHHSRDHHNEEISWMKLIGRDEESARKAEDAFYAKISGEDPEGGDVEPPSDLVEWLCTHCMDLPCQQTPQELHEIQAHIRTAHYVSDPQLSIDYYQDFEAPQGYLTETWPRASRMTWTR